MINSTFAQYAIIHTLIDTEFEKYVYHRNGSIIAKASVVLLVIMRLLRNRYKGGSPFVLHF